MRLTILLPTLNEREGIEPTIRSIPLDALTEAGFQVDVTLIDGASTDGTPEAAKALGAHVITESRKGYGRAYKTGFAKAKGDVVVTADADATYPLDRLVDYLHTFSKRHLDFATLDRFAEMERGSMTLQHRVGNVVLSFTGRTLYGVKLRDSQSGMWIISRKAIERLPLAAMSDGMAFSQQLKLAALRDRSLKAAELPGRYYPRMGEAKLGSWRDGTRNLGNLVKGRFTRSRP